MGHLRKLLTSTVLLIIVPAITISSAFFWNEANRTMAAYDFKEAIIRWPLGGFSYAIYNLDLTNSIEFVTKRKYLPFARSIALGKSYITEIEASKSCFAFFGQVKEINQDTCRELKDSEKTELKKLREEGRKKLKNMLSTNSTSFWPIKKE